MEGSLPPASCWWIEFPASEAAATSVSGLNLSLIAGLDGDIGAAFGGDDVGAAFDGEIDAITTSEYVGGVVGIIG